MDLYGYTSDTNIQPDPIKTKSYYRPLNKIILFSVKF